MSDFFNLNLDATLETTAKKSVFLNIPADTTYRIRFMPPTQSNGALFVLNTNHFKLQDEEDRGIAPACLKVHKDEPCPLCEVVDYMFESDIAAFKKVARDIKASNNWYAQVLLAKRGEDTKEGTPTWEYTGPHLMRFAKTGTDAINSVLKAQRAGGEPFICDPKKGKDVLFSRTGTGLQTKYTAMPTGEQNSLDKIFPKWKDTIITDITKELSIRFLTGPQMLAAAQRAHKELDWAKILKESGVTV